MTEIPSLPTPEVLEQVSAALHVPGGMPDDVWARISGAIEAESAARKAKPHRGAWLGGLAAASVAIVAVGLLAPTGTQAPAPVAAEAADVAVAAAPMVAAKTVSENPPARTVLASGQHYEPSRLREQVYRLLDTAGASNTRLMANVETDPTPTEGTDGFTATVEGERACLNGLTQADQALVIDRAEFLGLDAGIVVLPPEASSHPGSFEVFVVAPDCSVTDPQVIAHSWFTLPTPAP